MTYADDTATQRQIEIFFTELAATDHVQKAVAKSGLPSRTVYSWRDNDVDFARRWTEARERYVDELEAEAHRRAVVGTDKGVWHQGAQVGTEKQYSDSILLAMLKAKRAQYGDKSKLELTGLDGGPVKVEESPTAIGRKLAFALSTAMRALDQERAAAGAAPESGEDMA